MKKKSIKNRVNVLVFLFSLVFAVICIHLYFDSMADRAEQVQRRVIELEKDFTATTLAEEDALKTLAGLKLIKTRYHTIEAKCSECHKAPGTRSFSNRYSLFQDLFNTRETYRKKLVYVGDELMGLVDSVSYIHGHHIAYLKNFLVRGKKDGSGFPDVDNPSLFDDRLPSYEPETEIIRISVQVQTSLVDIIKSFNDLQMKKDRARVNQEFETRMKAFFDTVKTFDDYSLDAQDGILVEELLLVGRSINAAFSELLVLDRQREDFERQLDISRESIIALFNSIDVRLEGKNRGLRRLTTLLKAIFLLIGMVFMIWIIVNGARIVKEIKRTVRETETLQDDLSYEISITDSVFEEFQVVYQAMNAMAGKINTQMEELKQHRDRLEQRVAERTRDLFRTNQELRSEIQVRMAAEKELLDSRERLTMALDISGGHVWEWNQANGTMLLSGAILEAIGADPSKGYLSLEEFEKLQDPDDVKSTHKRVLQLIKGETSQYLQEHRIRWGNGEWHTYRAYGKVVKRDSNGRAEILLGTAIDVTEQKRMETKSKELEKRLQLSQKMEAIGTLARGIAHDFNNILGGIMGCAQLAKRNLSPETKPYSYVDQILAASVRAKDLIQQIMTFSRANTSEKEPCGLEVIVMESLKLLRASIPRNIDITHEVQPGNDSILANPTQMHQVVMNLCTNAYQAMTDTGGILSVSIVPGVQAAFPSLENGNKVLSTWVKLVVSDNGCGMDEAVIARMFDPYFTTKQRGQGNGMGLATVHAIIREHGGHIQVTSSPGRGSTFEVYLPEADRNMGNAPSEQAALPFGSERILVVDDEPILTNVLTASLEDLGYSVIAVNDAEEALAMVRENPDAVDLILLDYIMPKMKGDVLASEIVRIRDTVPIVLCTGLKDPLTEAEKASAGIREVLSKPVDINYMAERVRAILDQA